MLSVKRSIQYKVVTYIITIFQGANVMNAGSLEIKRPESIFANFVPCLDLHI